MILGGRGIGAASFAVPRVEQLAAGRIADPAHDAVHGVGAAARSPK